MALKDDYGTWASYLARPMGEGWNDFLDAVDAVIDNVDYAEVSGNDAATDVTAAELEELSDGSATTLHSHSFGSIDYAVVSGNDAATDVTAAELEELTDGSTTTLHAHALPTIDYAYVTALDAATDVTAAELEELTDGSTTTLHGHALSTLGGLTDVVITSVADNEFLTYDSGSGDWINQTAGEVGVLPLAAGSGSRLTGDLYFENNQTIYFRNSGDSDDIRFATFNGSNEFILGTVDEDFEIEAYDFLVDAGNDIIFDAATGKTKLIGSGDALQGRISASATYYDLIKNSGTATEVGVSNINTIIEAQYLFLKGVKVESSAPTTADYSSGRWGMHVDDTGPTIKLCVNYSGTLYTVALT